MRVNLTLVYAMGLPTGAPVCYRSAYQYQKTLPLIKG
jgi:hypothetical protein